jgi:hypothetical protein
VDKKIIVTLLIAVIATVSIASASYYVANQPNQTQNSPSPTPTPTPTPTPSPTPTPTPSEDPTEPASIPKPSVPEFTLEFVIDSYDVPPTYGIDQYTGDTVITEGGYHVDNNTIELTIKNQPYTYSYNNSSAWIVYNVMVKGHFGEDWKTIYYFDKYTGNNLPKQSPFGFTVITVPAEYPANATLDFRVQALRISNSTLGLPPLNDHRGCIRSYRLRDTRNKRLEQHPNHNHSLKSTKK